MNVIDSKDWQNHAEGDIRSARSLVVTEDFEPRVVCFLAQQGVEKYLKSVLVMHETRFPRTHDLEHLATRVQAVEPGIILDMESLRWLTQFAVVQRYAVGTFLAITMDDAVQALKIASTVGDEVKSLMPSKT